jgi:membrane protein DedA with SNARE-associated domain
MSILITSLIAGTTAIVGSIIGFFIGDRRRRNIEADRAYDELLRYYDTDENAPEDNFIM